MILRYIIGAILVILTMIVQTIFQPIIALFVKSDGNMPWFLKVFQPYDTLATGDENFWNNEMKDHPSNYYRCLMWGWRNAGWGMMGYMGFKVKNIVDFTSTGGEVDIGDSIPKLGSVYRSCKNGWFKYFDYKKCGSWTTSYGYMVQFGWSLNGCTEAPKGDIRRLCIDVRPRIKLEQTK